MEKVAEAAIENWGVYGIIAIFSGFVLWELGSF